MVEATSRALAGIKALRGRGTNIDDSEEDFGERDVGARSH